MQVKLRHIARDDHAGTETKTRQEHLHLLRRRVLRFVQDNEAVVQGTPRMNASGAISMTPSSISLLPRSMSVMSKSAS